MFTSGSLLFTKGSLVIRQVFLLGAVAGGISHRALVFPGHPSRDIGGYITSIECGTHTWLLEGSLQLGCLPQGVGGTVNHTGRSGSSVWASTSPHFLLPLAIEYIVINGSCSTIYGKVCLMIFSKASYHLKRIVSLQYFPLFSLLTLLSKFPAHHKTHRVKSHRGRELTQVAHVV